MKFVEWKSEFLFRFVVVKTVENYELRVNFFIFLKETSLMLKHNAEA